jgi:serine protease Do
MMPGTNAKLTLLRDGKEQTVDVTLAELQPSRTSRDDSGEAGSGSGYGLSVEPLTRDSARQLGVTATSGVVVTNVASGSRAADAGLRQGDVIEQVDGNPVNSPDALRSALDKQTGAPALLLVHRGDATVFMTIERNS